MSSTTASNTIPYNFTPREYQLPFLQAMDGGCKRAVLVWHRRAGKDKTVWNYMVKRAVEQVGTYYYILPTYNQGRKIIWDGMDKDGFRFLDHVPHGIQNGKPNESEMKIELKNGSVIQVIGSDNIDRIVGTNPIGVVFSEYPLQRANVWDFIRPILAENGGWAVFDFTPRGMNHGWKVLQQAREQDDWFAQVLTVDDTGAIERDVLAQERAEMPEDLYEQEYMCKFVEGAGAFFRNIDNVVYHVQPEKPKGRKYKMGADLAKYNDFTVLTSIDLHTRQVLPQDRFNQVDWRTQKASIASFCRKYNLGTMHVDATGVGDPVVEGLQDEGLNVVPYVFTERRRQELLDNLRILIAESKIWLPDDEGLLSELRSVQYSLSDTGRVKVGVPEGTHDDRVFSLALAAWELPGKVPEPDQTSVKRLLDREPTVVQYSGNDME